MNDNNTLIFQDVFKECPSYHNLITLSSSRSSSLSTHYVDKKVTSKSKEKSNVSSHANNDNNDDHDDNDESIITNDLSNVFFELANSQYVGYYTNNIHSFPYVLSNSSESSICLPPVIVKQDNDCLTHTGGIVWETSYLLAAFLESQHSNPILNKTKEVKSNGPDYPLGLTLEIGAGCGLLGLVLAANSLSSKVILTETEGPIQNLTQNVDRNIAKFNSIESSSSTISPILCNPEKVKVHPLNWLNFNHDIEQAGEDLTPHSFDTIVGTDVVFSTTLVIPLLETLHKMSHKQTNVFLCLQERCKDAHEMLLRESCRYFHTIEDISNQLGTISATSISKSFSSNECYWGIFMDCKLFRLNKRRSKIRKHKKTGCNSRDSEDCRSDRKREKEIQKKSKRKLEDKEATNQRVEKPPKKNHKKTIK